jgi:hypothetical protein
MDMAQGRPPGASSRSQQDPHEQRTLGPEQRLLEVFVGHWKINGQNAPSARGRAGARVQGEESYEWMPGDFFLLGRFCHRFGDGARQHEGIVVFGFDPPRRAFSSDHFDNLGYHRQYDLAVNDRVWIFKGRWERAVLRFDKCDRSFEVRWEMSKDGSIWMPLCDLWGAKLDA